MTATEMAGELPKACDTGTKRNSKGYRESWRGYRLHIDAADGDIPISRILTSASLHDSQAAIPLSRMTARRVDHCHQLMDAACDSPGIGFHACLTGRVAITDTNPRRDAALRERLRKEALAQRKAGHIRHDRVRYRQRSSGGRVNSALKDPYGARHVRVRGHARVACHLFFGVLALTGGQLMRLTIRHRRFRQHRTPRTPPRRGRRSQPCADGARPATHCGIPPHFGSWKRPGHPANGIRIALTFLSGFPCRSQAVDMAWFSVFQIFFARPTDRRTLVRMLVSGRYGNRPWTGESPT